MKHFICFGENYIVYVSGMMKAEDFWIEKADQMYLPGQNQEIAVKEFVSRNKLKKKTVIMALDSGIMFSALYLPKGRPKVLRGMVHNELRHLAGKEQKLLVSFHPAPGNVGNEDGESVGILAYSMQEQHFYDQLSLLKKAGLRCRKVYALTNCIGELAAKLLPNIKRIIFVEVVGTHVRLTLIEDGICLLVRVVRINVRHFYETGATELLYDEIAEQVSKIMQVQQADALLLTSDILEDPFRAARVLADNLPLSCQVVDIPIRVASDLELNVVKQHCQGFAVMVKASGNHSETVDFLAAARQAFRYNWLNQMDHLWFQTAVLLVFSIIFLVGFGLRQQLDNRRQMREIQELDGLIEDSLGQQDYQEAAAYIRQAKLDQAFLELVQAEETTLRKTKQLHQNDYQAICSGLSENSSITGMRYQQEPGIFEVDILADQPDEFPEIVSKIRETRQFASVTYHNWEQVRGNDDSIHYIMTILAELGEE